MLYNLNEYNGLNSKLDVSLLLNNVNTSVWNMTDGSQGLYMGFIENGRDFPNSEFVMCLYNYTNSTDDAFVCKHGHFD